MTLSADILASRASEASFSTYYHKTLAAWAERARKMEEALLAAKREHDHGCCVRQVFAHHRGSCTCGADAHNAAIDAALEETGWAVRPGTADVIRNESLSDEEWKR